MYAANTLCISLIMTVLKAEHTESQINACQVSGYDHLLLKVL